MNDTKPVQETEFVFRRLSEAFHLFGKEINAHYWLAILIPVLIAAAVYVVWMYVRDSQTVGGLWATFLGCLRCAVYVLLALVFLLPAWQTWETTETRSKVVLVFDVSGSTTTKDDLPTEAVPVEKLLTRQDKVIRLLTDDQVGFLQRLEEKNPVSAYRFGSVLDEESRSFSNSDQPWTVEQWNEWLKPNPSQEIPADLSDEEKAKLRKKVDLQALLVNGTNLGESLLSVIDRERSNMLQGIVVVSDGRSTQYSEQTIREVQARAERDKIPIFTVAVGEHRQPISIRITDLLVPDQARPDDKFPIRVEVDGEGLPDKDIKVTLGLYPPPTDPKKDRPAHELKATGRFSKEGAPPHAQVEFQVEAAQLPVDLRKPPDKGEKPGKPELVEGEWKFVARVARDRREAFLAKEHVTDPATVNIVKKPLRILLASSGPMHDFQFLRSLLVREADRKRVELSIYLQTALEGTVLDVPQERLLRRFPSSLHGPGEKGDKYDNLAEYDLIIAIDLDWLQLPDLPAQGRLLERWVESGGGLIVVGGPVHTFQLTRGANAEKVKPLLDLYPVVLDDSRLQGLGVERSTAEPWRLNFPGATAEMEFLKIDEDNPNPLAGWEEFFTGKTKAEAGEKSGPVRRGFYDYYPVKDVKPSATVVATFADPKARLSDGREQPYLVINDHYKQGKVVYLGSGETWRLRQCRGGEAFHERFWTKLARFAGSGNLAQLKSHGQIVMGKTFVANHRVLWEAQLKGPDWKGLPPTTTPKPKVQLKPPTGVTLESTEVVMSPTVSENEWKRMTKEQQDQWDGWFRGSFLATAAGNYELELKIPGADEQLSRKFVVTDANPELDNTQPDFTLLRQLAGEANDVLARVKEKDGERSRIKQELERTNRSQGQETPGEDKDRLRLYFDLKAAEMLPDCMITDSKSQKSRGRVQDWWDEGFLIRQEPPLKISYVLLGIVLLLSVEWLTRKLLKLA